LIAQRLRLEGFEVEHAHIDGFMAASMYTLAEIVEEVLRWTENPDEIMQVEATGAAIIAGGRLIILDLLGRFITAAYAQTDYYRPSREELSTRVDAEETQGDGVEEAKKRITRWTQMIVIIEGK
jgi:hypothetical protein